MKNFFKKNWLFFVLSFVALFLIALKLFANNSSVLPPVVETISLPKFRTVPVLTQSINYQFNLTLPTNLPKKLPVYKITSFKVDNYPELKSDLSGEKNINSDSQAQEIAQNFLSSRGISNFSRDQIQIGYRKIVKMNSYEATGSADIDVYVVNFWSAVDGFKIFTGSPNAPLSSVWVGKNGKIQKAFSSNFSLTKDSSFPLRSPETAQQDVFSQKGTLVYLETSGASEDNSQTPTGVSSIVFDSLSLVYFLPPSETDPVEPIYVFTGKALVQGQTDLINAAVYLPAIEERLLHL